MKNLESSEGAHYNLLNLEDSMPFLQLLQGIEPQPPLPPPSVVSDTAAEFLFRKDKTFVNEMIMKLLSPDNSYINPKFITN